MWRTRAVRSLLADVAGLRHLRGGDAEEEGVEGRAGDAVEEAAHRARHRAWFVIALDWAAILVLVLLQRHETPFLVLDRSEQAVFTLAVLAVAVHSGFRLGQAEKYGAVARASRELAERDPEAGQPS
jgi:hypothetical protein